MNELLGTKHSSDIAYIEATTSYEDIKCFEKEETDGPKLKQMQPYWNDLGSPWNDQLCELFLHHFTGRHTEIMFDEDTEEEIEDMFRRRLRSLKHEMMKGRPRKGERPHDVNKCMQQAHLRTLAQQRPNRRHAQISAPDCADHQIDCHVYSCSDYGVTLP
jgi:hypothetical protein